MDFIRSIENASGKKAIIEYKPIQPGDVPATWADTNDLTNELGYKPKTNTEEGVKKFVEWYIAFYKD
jgi:UDP-glucuronate 4-epimerase